MIKFEKLIETATSRMMPITTDKNRCSKARSPLSKCNKCLESCPVDGITIDKSGVTLNNNCIYCGLCASNCPTNAIFIQEPTELNLYDYIEEMGQKNNAVVLTCKKKEETSNTKFKVPCLGSLSLEFLFGIDLLPFDINIVFDENKCKECVVTNGIKNYLNTLERVKKLKKLLNLQGDSIKHLDKMPILKKNKGSKDEDIDDERREFLFSVFKSAKKLPNYAIKYMLGSEEENKKSKAVLANPTIEKFPILRKTLNQVNKEFVNVEINEHLKPTLVEVCNFCRACTILCPTGSLKYKEEGDKLEINLIKEACTGCGLCAEVCYYKALEMKPKTVGDFISKGSSTLVYGIKQKCSICKKTITASENIEICSSCLKLGRANRR